MTVKIEYIEGFIRKLRKYKKAQKTRYDLILYKISLFQVDVHHPSLRTHKLKGSKRDFWSFWIEGDLRIIYAVRDNAHIIFVDIGTHAEVYR